MTKEFYCPKCDQDIPFLNSTWEGINPLKKLHWFVNYCPRCGTVTSVEQTPFHLGNLIPRIGKIKSFLFIALLLGTPFHLLAWSMGGIVPGILISGVVLLFATLAYRQDINQVDTCSYIRWEQYPELVRR